MAVKGASKVVSNYRKLVDKISGQMSQQTLNHVLSIGAAQAKIYTPVDTAALINSQQITTTKTASGYKGYVFYTVDYALPLETKDNWTPRFKATAKPHFLQSGFEDPSPMARIRNAIVEGYKI